MNKYKLINKTTGTETLCDKVTIDGFDYYVSDEKIQDKNPFIDLRNNELDIEDIYWAGSGGTAEFANTIGKLVIATTNPSIDLPKVVDEVEKLALEYENSFTNGEGNADVDFKAGYKKSQETNPFSEEDMFEFSEWCNKEYEFDSRGNEWFHGNGYYATKELFKIWQEQRPKVLFYE